MAPTDINLNLSGVNPSALTVVINTGSTDANGASVSEQLTAMQEQLTIIQTTTEAHLSDLSANMATFADSLTRLSGRLTEDWDHAKQAFEAAIALAAQNKAADDATIADLRSQMDAAGSGVLGAATALDGIDLDRGFPVIEVPTDPPVDETPVEDVPTEDVPS